MIYQRQATFSEAVSQALTQNYCNFNGRASRSQYWWYALFTFIIGCVVNIFSAVWPDFGYVLSGLVSLGLLLPGLGIAVRRLHDINKSGWWLLLALIPLVGAIILIIWFCKNSEMEQNQYGPVPLMVER